MASELNVLAHMLDRIGEEQPALARLHAGEPARRHHRGRRLLPGLSHLRRRAAAGRAEDRAVARAQAIVARAAAQPGDGSVALRLLPRGDAAARSGRAPRRHRAGAARRLSAGRRERGARAAAVRDEAAAVHRARCRPRASRTRPSIATTCCCRSTRSAAIRRASAGRSRSSTREPPRGSATGRARCSPPRRTTRSSARTCARGSTCSRRCPTSGRATSRAGCG